MVCHAADAQSLWGKALTGTAALGVLPNPTGGYAEYPDFIQTGCCDVMPAGELCKEIPFLNTGPMSSKPGTTQVQVPIRIPHKAA